MLMNNLPRQMLRRILAKYGKDICSDARRCEGLLNDLCGSHRREINVLVNAIEERIPLDLLAGASSMPTELLLTRLEKRLEDQTAMTREAARWSVESWALALGVATDAEIEEKARKQSDPPSPKAEKIQPTEPENKATNQGISNTNRANPVQPKTQRHVPSSKTAPPVNRQPAKIPQPSPPVNLPTNNQPPVQTPAANPQLQPSNPVVIYKSRLGIFRGCLIVIFLLFLTSVILFFGVPYAFEVMRETQRERNNEPPRFPVH
jgi:hypothetical protein